MMKKQIVLFLCCCLFGTKVWLQNKVEYQITITDSATDAAYTQAHYQAMQKAFKEQSALKDNVVNYTLLCNALVLSYKKYAVSSKLIKKRASANTKTTEFKYKIKLDVDSIIRDKDRLLPFLEQYAFTAYCKPELYKDDNYIFALERFNEHFFNYNLRFKKINENTWLNIEKTHDSDTFNFKNIILNEVKANIMCALESIKIEEKIDATGQYHRVVLFIRLIDVINGIRISELQMEGKWIKGINVDAVIRNSISSAFDLHFIRVIDAASKYFAKLNNGEGIEYILKFAKINHAQIRSLLNHLAEDKQCNEIDLRFDNVAFTTTYYCTYKGTAKKLSERVISLIENNPELKNYDIKTNLYFNELHFVFDKIE